MGILKIFTSFSLAIFFTTTAFAAKHTEEEFVAARKSCFKIMRLNPETFNLDACVESYFIESDMKKASAAAGDAIAALKETLSKNSKLGPQPAIDCASFAEEGNPACMANPESAKVVSGKQTTWKKEAKQSDWVEENQTNMDHAHDGK